MTFATQFAILHGMSKQGKAIAILAAVAAALLATIASCVKY